MSKLTKKDYNNSLINITKMFCNDELTLDEYKYLLHELCSQFRKEPYFNGNA